MDVKFRVAIRIAKPVHEVFEAVADPGKLSCYFTTGGAKGRLETGATVSWDFHDFPGAFPVEVEEVIPNEKIVLHWKANDGGASEPYETTILMTFEALEDGRTLIAITETGWHDTQSSMDAAFGNCFGWSQMVCALKAWLEHGINLREGAFK